jgi:hypothetical protein
VADIKFAVHLRLLVFQKENFFLSMSGKNITLILTLQHYVLPALFPNKPV